MRVGFAGTPEFAARALAALHDGGYTIPLVLTQPDRPSGRGMSVAPSPVKRYAQAHALRVEQPASLRSADTQSALRAVDLDVLVVAAYGLILPQPVLDWPRRGCLNIHASLLPRWRGAAPIARAILAGDAATGVCIMRMEAGLDTGPVMLARELAIGARTTAGELELRLAEEGGAALAAALDALAAGTAKFTPQDPRHATYAAKLTKAEARLDWREDAAALERRVRALNPRPVAETTLDGAQLRIFESQVVSASPGAVPGTILSAGAGGIVVMTGEQALALTRVQLPGRRAVTAAELANSRPLAGQVLA